MAPTSQPEPAAALSALPPLNVAEILRAHALRPDKRLGQNFLVDQAALLRIVAAAELTPGAAVLEIGPGLGSLTRCLAAAGAQVTAVELDERLLPALRQVLSPYPAVRIVPGDILKLDAGTLVGQAGYTVAANIPYYITSAVIRHLLEADLRPQRVVLTVQREVAERICAAPGDLSLLALSVQFYGTPRLVGRIPAGAFYPAPQVDSAVVRVDLLAEPPLPPERAQVFFRLARAGFGQKRKTLRNAFLAGLGLPAAQVGDLLEQAGIDPRRRAETLGIAEWLRLVEAWEG